MSKQRSRRIWCGCALILCFAGCAAPLQTGHRPQDLGQGNRGWLDLREGKSQAAEAQFARALAHDPADARARFGAANLAYERGDGTTAVQYGLALLETASRGDRLALVLSTATLARVSRLLAEIPDRSAAESRLTALDGSRLPWPARYALALVLMDIARKRGDAGLLAKAAANAGCVTDMTMVGRGGRLPYADAADDRSSAVEQPRPLVRAACQLQLNLPDSGAGIRVLESRVDLNGGRYDVVLDFNGPARVRVDGGAWHEHGGTAAYGPRWSAATLDLGAGKHTIEVRVGSYDATTDLALMVSPSVAPAEFQGDGSATGDQVMMALAGALAANLVGDASALLGQLAKLEAESQFAVGLAAAARLEQVDPTRPADIQRDKARALFARAIALDPGLARTWLDLSNLDMQKSRPREAALDAGRAITAAPGWWPGHLGSALALRAQGFDQAADQALEAAMKLLGGGNGACVLVEHALDRAQDRNQEAAAGRLVERLSRCDAQSDAPRLWMQRHGDLAGAKAWLDRNLGLTSEPLWLRSERADVLLGMGDIPAARDALAALAQLAPRDGGIRVRLADALAASGQRQASRRVLAQALASFPGREDVRSAARLAGLPMPLEAYRVDGRAVIRAFVESGRKYQAPAVVVLDRAVERVFPDGARLMLTHTITQALSKEAIEQVGEVTLPEGAEVLSLRTHKADGSIREAEEIAGKATISVPNLAVGDFVESETVEFKPARDAVAPGFIGERFYFQSFDAPLDRSEYVFLAPASAALRIDARAGAPTPVETQIKDDLDGSPNGGLRVLRFAAQAVPQVFAERSAVPPQTWIPSVRVSSGVAVEAWSRFIADGFLRVSRGAPDIAKLAAQIASAVGGDRARLPEAMVGWVREHIEPEADFADSATATLARGRGNRTALLLALARSLGVRADLLLARSLLLARPETPVQAEDLDDFREVLLRFPAGDGDRFVDPQLRRAPFAYLPPALTGTQAIVAGEGRAIATASPVRDARQVALRAELQADGRAQVQVVEKVSGWPAVEWTELLDRTGKDQDKLRQEFEQRWLGQQFPGAQLDTLAVDSAASGTQVSYAFNLPGMATRRGNLLQLRPSFFQSQPGHRFGTEAERKTTLLLGFDIPVDLDAEIVLPAGAKVVDPGRDGNIEVGKARFVEKRSVTALPDGRTKLVLHRQSRLPLMWVAPEGYADVAAKLRAVDPVEQGEVRIAVGQ